MPKVERLVALGCRRGAANSRMIASHGAEFEAYNVLDPGVHVAILKALCDIRVEVDEYMSDTEKCSCSLFKSSALITSSLSSKRHHSSSILPSLSNSQCNI